MANISQHGDVDAIIRKIKKLESTFNKKDLKKLQNEAGKPLINAMKSGIKASDAPHNRYYKNGGLAATYFPGNLKRSIRRLTMRGAGMSWFGPKTDKNTSAGKVYKGNAVDGWYAHFVEYGLSKRGVSTSKGFTRKAYDGNRETVKQALIKGLTQKLNEYKRMYETI